MQALGTVLMMGMVMVMGMGLGMGLVYVCFGLCVGPEVIYEDL